MTIIYNKNQLEIDKITICLVIGEKKLHFANMLTCKKKS